MKEELLKMNLQFFAEQDGGSDESGTDGQDSSQQDEEGSDEQQEEMIPKSQMEKIIKDRVAREKKATEKAVEEAKRLAKMNEDEKQQYELEQLQKELEEYKRKDSFYGLSKEAAGMLDEKGIKYTDKLFTRLVGETAEDTAEAINDYAESVLYGIEQGVKQALSGTAPKVHSTANNALTKKDILAEKDATKRIRLIQENPNLFN